MTPAARLAAAIEVFGSLESDRRPAGDALKAWGLAHRFAGSGDRAAISGLVYDALRRRASSAWLMGAETPRAILLGMLKRERGLDSDAIGKLASGAQYAPEALSDEERKRLDAADMAGAAPHIVGDYPEWLDAHFARAFGDARVEEGAALASRAPLDLRVNALKAERDKVAGQLSDLKPEPARWSPWGLRVRLSADAKSPAIHAEPAFLKGMVEVQDEGSHCRAAAAPRRAGDRSLRRGRARRYDGGEMRTRDRFCTDDDKRRLAPIHARLERAGVRNVQVRTPKSVGNELADLAGRMDLVLIDAPCTGVGAWRRNPDAKWRMRPGALEQRIKEQAEILDRAVPLLKAGGRIAYVTCSVLDEENGAQVRAFLSRHPEFSVQPPAEVAHALGERAFMFLKAARLSDEGLLMTPRTTETDGFFVSLLKRS
jgi:16S rRNA (cytosine967-C5)-methyltransferase